MKLSRSQKERYSRTLKLRDVTEENMEIVAGTEIAMVGAGGIGSPTLRLLASLGFGKIKIIDPDVVELSNIQRQNVYNVNDIGKSKAECAARNLSLMNPDIEYEPVVIAMNHDNAAKLLNGVNIVVDGLDSFETRKAVNEVSVKLRIPYIFAGAVEYYANLTTFLPGKTGCLNCVMGDVQDNPENTAAAIGVSPELLSIVAGIEAHEAFLLATGREPILAGRLLAVDISTLSFDMFDIGRVENCRVCGNSGAKE